MSDFTQAQKNEYMEDASLCPTCHSDNINAEHVQIDNGNAVQQVSCIDCETVWLDIYSLTDVKRVNP